MSKIGSRGGLRLGSWASALRPLGIGMTIPPVIYGLAAGEPPGYAAASLAIAFAVIAQAVAVFANDLADEETDRANTTFNLFSGGSRVLVRGALTSADLAYALVATSIMFVLGATAAGLALSAMHWPMIALTCIACSLAYSLPPIRAVYRGFGPLIQGLGTGIALPAAGATAAGESLLETSLWLYLAPSAVAAIAANIVTALPDTPSDAAHDKMTFPVTHGERRARIVAWTLALLAVISLAAIGCPRTDGLHACLGVGLAPLAAALPTIGFASSSRRLACSWFVAMTLGGPTLEMLTVAAVRWSGPSL